MKTIVLSILLTSIILFSGCVYGQLSSGLQSASPNVEQEGEAYSQINEEPLLGNYDNVCLYYFRSVACTHCQEVEDHMNELRKRGVAIRVFNVFESERDKEILDLFYEYYGIAEDARGVPAVAAGEFYFLGDIDILTELVKFMNDHVVEGIECLSFY